MPPTHLHTTRELTKDQARLLLDKAHSIKKNSSTVLSMLKGKTVLQLFIENSTRTKISFETAVKNMGGSSMTLAVASSSLSKGETLLDTVLTLKQYDIDAIVMRHPSSGASIQLADELSAQKISLPIINAGDGTHEHPTQALLDAMTLEAEWGVGGIQNKTVLIVGDILHSRVARSNLHLLSCLGAKIILCAPKTLLPSDLSLFPKCEVVHRLDSVLSKADAVMMLRIQLERQNGMAIPSREEYRKFWGLTNDRLVLLKKSAIILHPGPQNRGVEIDSEAMDDSRCRIHAQVENGVYVRMAVLARAFT